MRLSQIEELLVMTDERGWTVSWLLIPEPSAEQKEVDSTQRKYFIPEISRGSHGNLKAERSFTLTSSTLQKSSSLLQSPKSLILL